MNDDLWNASGLAKAARTDNGPARRLRRLRSRTHLGGRLRDWRVRQGLSQLDAHAQLGLTGPASRIHALENGQLPWAVDDVAVLADALGADPEELVREAMSAGDPDADARRARFVAWARTLPDHEWQSVVDEVNTSR